MENRGKYTIASEKAKDLRNDHKAAKDIIKQARMAEKDALASIKDNCQVLSASIQQLQASVEECSQLVPDAVLGEQSKIQDHGSKHENAYRPQYDKQNQR